MNSSHLDHPDGVEGNKPDEIELRRRLRRGGFRQARIYAVAALVGATSLATLVAFGPSSDAHVPAVPDEQLKAAQTELAARMHAARPEVAQAQVVQAASARDAAVDVRHVEETPTPALGGGGVKLDLPVNPSRAEKPRNPSSSPPPVDTAAFLNRAREQLRRGDIAAARRLLERIADSDGQALFALAETYDPEVLTRWGAVGIKPNLELARALYEKAALQGVQGAGEHQLAEAR